MKFEYTGRHIEVTPALRNHVEGHFGKIDHIFNDSSNAHVIIDVDKGKHHSEIVLKWRNRVLTAEAISNDMYKALSKTIDKLEKQALKQKNKVIDKHHKAKKAVEVDPKVNEIEPSPVAPRIIKTRSYAVKPMTDEEAILTLNGEENQFLVYRDAVTENVSVIYKRKDGNYGLIQP
jgi:putative sigma-54 modulation protein